MSHLQHLLNHDHGGPHASKLDDHRQPAVDQLDVSSSAEEDISPGSDDEVDELLEDETDGEMEYYDEEPPTTPLGTTSTTEHPSDTPHHENSHDSKPDPILDSFPLRREEKRPEPAPRRKLEKHDRKIDLGLHDHKAHADCPDTLACLPDTHGRPQHTLPVILRCAILGSPRKRLTIREIYATMESKYPYYKTAGQTWKQSVRHHLSLNRLFERQPRPVTDPGFGSYWTVNLSAPPGTKRPRKRGRPNKESHEGGSATKKSSSHKNHPQSHPGQLDQPLKFQFQPQTHPAPPPPPLPPQQPQGNPVALHHPHHHNMHVLQNHSPPMSHYHSPPEANPPLLQHAQTAMPLPPPSLSPLTSQNHHRHEHPHPNHYQNHRQHQTRPLHQHNSLPPSHIPHHPSLSPSIPPPAPPLSSAHPHQYSQQHQQIYVPHQRPHQDQYPPPSQHLPPHSSQIVSSQSRPSLNHSHSQPLEHHDSRRQSASYPLQRKGSLPVNPARDSAYPLISRDPDGDDIMSINDGIRNGPTISDDDYESEEDTDDRHHRRLGTGVFIPTKPSPIFSLPPFSVLTPPHRQELLEQMRQEIATLRRTSAEAVSTSIRLSEQLANANLEVSRSREAVRDLEDMLQDEAAKRKELEKLRALEMDRRRAAEDALSSTIRSPTRVRAT